MIPVFWTKPDRKWCNCNNKPKASSLFWNAIIDANITLHTNQISSTGPTSTIFSFTSPLSDTSSAPRPSLAFTINGNPRDNGGIVMISFSIKSLSTAVEVLNSSWLLSISSGRVSLSACYQIPMIQTSELYFSRYNLEMMISKFEYLLDPLESLEDILAVVKICMRTYYLRLQRENNNRCWKQRSDRQQVHIGLVCICGIDQCRKYIYIPNYSNYQPKSFIHNMHFQLFVMYLCILETSGKMVSISQNAETISN